MKSSVAAAAVLSICSTAYAATPAKQCQHSNVCFQLQVPDATASSGDGDIFFQISAPTSYAWVALGQGSSMTGSNIFVVYTSSDGNNVTLSPRLGQGHSMPQHDTSADVTLLDGSGVSNGMMTANVKCSNCNSWSGGTMDFTSDNSNWIYAYKSGSSMDTDDVSASINRHDGASPFSWSLAAAKGGSDVNPFVDSASSTASASGVTSATSGTASGTASATSSGTASGTASSSATATATSADFNQSGVPFGGDYEFGDRITRIHGVLASLAFVAIFPIGGILIRIASFTGLIWVHAALQMFAYAIYFVAFGMGAYLMRNLNASISSHTHPVIGGLLFLVLLSQPVTGYVHHRMFAKYGRRTGWSHVHLYIGRVAIVLGIINGGLGINLAGDVSTGGKVAYGIFAGIMLIAYITSIVIGERRKRAPSSFSRSQIRRLSDSDTPPGGVVALQERFK